MHSFQEPGMKARKILSILGGGSVWTPFLINELVRQGVAHNLEIRLHGRERKKLLDVVNLSIKLTRQPLTIHTALDFEEAVDGAWAILNQVRIGGWAARIKDETLPVQLGAIGDESLGLGGLLAANRTWAYVAAAAELIRRHAGNAWLLNMTNPSDLVSRAWYANGCRRVISLCDHPQVSLQEAASLAEVPERSSDFAFIGMTHVGWIIPPAGVQLDPLIQKQPELADWIPKWGAIPTGWRIRMNEADALARHQLLAPGTRAQYLQTLVSRLRKAIRMGDVEGYLSLLERRTPSWYATSVVPALNGLMGRKPERLVVGTPNNGRLSGLEDDVFIEGWTKIDRNGIRAEPFPENPKCLRDIVEFGRLRSLAFAVVSSPNPEKVAAYLEKEPFARHIDTVEKLKMVMEMLSSPVV